MIEGALLRLVSAGRRLGGVHDLRPRDQHAGHGRDEGGVGVDRPLSRTGRTVRLLLSCRQPMPGAHDAFISAHWKQSVGSLAHCLAGDATGIMLAAVLTYRFGFPNGIDLILEYTAAFLFGWMVFQALFMKSMLGGSYVVALRGTFFAEFVSIEHGDGRHDSDDGDPDACDAGVAQSAASAVLGRDVDRHARRRLHRLSDQFVDGAARHQARHDVGAGEGHAWQRSGGDAGHGNACYDRIECAATPRGFASVAAQAESSCDVLALAVAVC